MKTAARENAQDIRSSLRNRSSILVLAGVALALASTALTAQADVQFSSFWQPTSDTHVVADGRLVDVQIRVEGRTAPLYFRPSQFDRHYFQAFEGQNYALVVTNNTPRRVGVLIAVDGLNVVNGERSKLSRTEPMYVLDPYESATISGWRTSLDHIRRFVFVDEERSYAERTGQANGDMGWIRVLSFNEQQQRAWWNIPKYKDVPGRRGARPEGNELGDRDDRSELAPEAEAPRAQAESKTRQGLDSARESVPGTGWGRQGYDPVQRTVFVAMLRPTDKLAFRYEYASGLRALGIFPAQSRVWEREQGQLGFAKPPRW